MTMETNPVTKESPVQVAPLEATFVTIAKNVVREKIPQHKKSFDIFLDDINEQITGDGLFEWESKDRPGVKFLAGHLTITPDLINKIANNSLINSQEAPIAEQDEEADTQRLEHYVYVIEPSFGIGRDGSALSALDMAIERAVKEAPKIARAIRTGEKPPTIDMLIAGGPTALGGKVTREFVDSVRANGFSEYGKLYAEFTKEQLQGFDLDKTRIVIQGAFKGAITSDQTYDYLPSDIQKRTQLLLDNPAGVHGRNIPTQTGRTINMGGLALDVGVRMFAGSVKGSQFKDQGKFYDQITAKKGLDPDSSEDRKLKGELFKWGEVKSLAKGSPLSTEHRSFSRISTPDPTNINVRNIARVVSAPFTERLGGLRDRILGKNPEPRRALTVKGHGWTRDNEGEKHGGRLTFATGNTTHNFPWVRSVDSGSWAQKMKFIEQTHPPKTV